MKTSREKGSALIVSLFVVSIVAVLALSMMERLSRDLKRSELLLNSIQAELYAEGSFLWAADNLRYQFIQQKSSPAGEAKLPYYSPISEIGPYTFSSVIYNAKTYFESYPKINVNNQSYLVETTVNQGGKQFHLYSVVEGSLQNSKAQLRILWQTQQLPSRGL